MQEYIFLIIILIIVGFIFYINKKRNAWDVMFFNSTLAIVALFMIGILNSESWEHIVYSLGVVATGTGIAAVFKR